MKNILLLLLSFFIFAFEAQAQDFSPLKELPVLDAGRVKPFDTFARESLQLIYGRQTYKSPTGITKPAIEVVFTWMLLPEHWVDVEMVEINFRELKTALKLTPEKKYFSMAELLKNDRLPALIQDLNTRIEEKEKLNPFFQALQRVKNQIAIFQAVTTGTYPGWVPMSDKEGWQNFQQMDEAARNLFSAITKAFIEQISSGKKESADLKTAVGAFIQFVKQQDAFHAYNENKIDKEILLNTVHPFMWGWVFFFLAAISIFLFKLFDQKIFYSSGWFFYLIAFLLCTSGFALRIYLAGRPPVSNMYESVIWVSFGVSLFALIFETRRKTGYLLLAAGLVAGLSLMVADFAPNILDRSIQPLEPVLRSNLWLTVHVLTITLSYAAFFLAFGLSDLGLFYYLKDETKFKTQIDSIVLSAYRAVQVGVVLLAAGTILGGVWADYSWGRFWGWDPKETWALIALLGYLALLHAKLGGLVRNFGLLAGCIVAFSLVLMAWYGVNYVLGAGLHSYGFGGGGIEYVASFVGIHLIYVVFVANSRKKAAKV